jgi:hypothetical protein
MNEPKPSLMWPTRSVQDFDSIEEWEEAMARWRSTVGRNRAIAERVLLDFRVKAKRKDKQPAAPPVGMADDQSVDLPIPCVDAVQAVELSDRYESSWR